VLAVHLLATDVDLLAHLCHEAPSLLNLAGLLLGFAVLTGHFERSHLPARLPHLLPAGRAGAFVLLVLVALLSSVLDNIAAALIGGTAAATLFRGRVHLGYLAAIVAASNAGGAGSVIGDTTTTMLWLEGASPWHVAEAALGATVAVAFFGVFASAQQHALQPLVRGAAAAPPLDRVRLAIVGLVLAGAIAANVVCRFPAAGVGLALALGAGVRATPWRVLGRALPGTAMLLCLVLTASLMPIDALLTPTASTTFGLGLVSAVFDNIPLTKLAIEQNAYDWGLLAFAVGYGGSMLWFGSSAGVAIAGVFPQARSATAWLARGWHVVAGYGLGYLVMLLVLGWHPHALAT
jgi:Na+/H+ antiporter NhaD/arsenite permease-like protein